VTTGPPPSSMMAFPILILANLTFFGILLGDTKLVGLEWVGFGLLAIWVIISDIIILEMILEGIFHKKENKKDGN